VNEYELMLLTNAELDDEARNGIYEKAKTVVSKAKGTWVGLDDWGRRKLAYEINKTGEATYALMNFDCEPATLDEVVRQLRITDGVMRVMAVNRVKPLPEGAELETISDEEHAAGPPQRGRGGRGGRGGGGRDRGDRER
jgi:small subunit ribosomal protein S6